MGTNVTNNSNITDGKEINLSAQWIQVLGSPSKYLLSNMTNNSGTWWNTSWSSFATGNWSNFTFPYPEYAVNGNVTYKIFANGTGNTQNVTQIWFFYNITTSADTCTYSGSGDWYIDMKDNCTLSTANILTGNMYIYSTAYGITTFANTQKAHAYYLNASTGTWFYNNYRWLY
jgi:hypothetical protein